MADITRADVDILIPVEVSQEIIKAVPQDSYALRLLRRLPNMSAKQYKLPIVTALAAAGFVSGDSGIKMTSKATWGSKEITAEEIATIIPIPEAVLDDSSYDIWGEIRPQIVQSIGQVIDAAVFFGTGKPDTWPVGLIPQAITAGNTVAAGTGVDIAADISEAMSMVEADGYDVSGFASDVALKGNLRNLRDKNNQPIYQPSLVVGSPTTLYGVQIEHVKNGSWNSATARLLGGDFSQAVYSVRQDVTYKILDQATLTDAQGTVLFNLAQQDMVALRVVMRLGWQVANPINPLNPTDSTRFPFAALTPPAESTE